MASFGGSFGPAKGSGPGAMKGGAPGPYGGGPPGGGPPLGMEPAELNEDGLPIRPGKDECLLYKNTGACKNGTDCIFHHPRKSEQGKGGMMPIMAPMPGGPPGLSGPPGGMDGPPGMSDGPPGISSSAPPMSGPPQGMPPPEASSNNTALKDGDAAEEKPAEEKKEATVEAAAPEPPREVQFTDEGLPMRPEMQKCWSYMKTGRCTYGPTCRFDHPAGLGGLLAGQTGFGNYPGMIGGPMTEGGMAMRPGREQCPFLKRTKTCPFGPECRFDHSVVPAADVKSTPDAKDAPLPPAPAPAPAPPLSRKKDKGLGGVRGRRNVPMWRGQP